MLSEPFIEQATQAAGGREALWQNIISGLKIRSMAEIGVWKGEFARRILDECPSIEHYYLVDPWRTLESWNKPWNVDNETFDAVFQEAQANVSAHGNRCTFLRGTTIEVAGQIPADIDFAYVDGDHTLRGIAIDLINVYSRLRDGGYLAGDDFSPTIWQHDKTFEPTMVFPFVTYFAEAVGAELYALPYNQFIMTKRTSGTYRFHDLAGKYADNSVLSQVKRQSMVDKAKAFSRRTLKSSTPDHRT